MSETILAAPPSTLERVAKIVWQTLDGEPIEITRETDLESLGVDSLDIVEIVMNAEDEFDVDLVELDFMDPPYLVGKVADAIDAKLAEKVRG